MHIDLSISRVRHYRLAQGWSVLRLAKAAGVNESTIRKIDDPNWSPVADTLRRLERIIPQDFDVPSVPVNDNRAMDDAPGDAAKPGVRA
ncbi:multiprotein-bridging factor 1 family protein [Dongia soli]|uniref:Helix-turn-helix transcriptional regulator n=1 Tax=Dongia soli TaxID=600628 RepID=A0ABU5E7X0_9PROT|nr:helix-turn-helix transcriptional regulator [Dongia soli]MDY0882284.1 helix-turn-helix transcriptional regulator [Dongia soli]